MNEKSKKIHVNASSLADLKAELLRKQQEFRQVKLQGSSQRILPLRKEKPAIWSKKNAGVLERAQKDQEAKEEESSDLRKSRTALEAKAKLYEKMSQSNNMTENESDENCLVDFQKKALDEKLEERLRDRQKEEDEERQQLMELEPKIEPGKEWVDYVDTDGKSRRCLSEDLDMLREQSKVKPIKSLADTLRPDAEMLSEDMKRELQRQKWEKEVQANSDGPVHYSNVQFDEQRSHGVGYFQFAKQEEERKEQMDALKQLREQTLTQRSQRERVKAKRQAMMEARLAKVKQRRMVQEGGALIEKQEEKSDEDEEFGPKLDEALKGIKSEPEELKRDDSLRKNAPTREWDKGKPKFSTDTWVDKQREERPNEFAPPQEYYADTKPAPKLQKKAKWKSHKLYTEETFLSELEGDKSDTVPAGYSERLNSTEIDQVDAGLTHIRTQIEQNVLKAASGANTSSTSLDIPLPPHNYQESNSETSGMDFRHTPHYEQEPHHIVPPLASRSDGTYVQSLEQEYAAHQFAHSQQCYNFSQQDTPMYGDYPLNYSESSQMNSQTDLAETNSCYLDPYDSMHMNVPNDIPEKQDILTTTESTADQIGAELQSNTINSETKSSGPQPAHYSSAPQRVQPKPAPYVPLHLHKVAPTLPAPPSETNIPTYKSMESVHQKRISAHTHNQEKVWHRQFSYSNSSNVKSSATLSRSETSQKPGTNLLVPAGIPFPAPHVQNDSTDNVETIQFDPTKPPPLVTHTTENV